MSRHKKDYPTDREIRHLQQCLDNGILLAQQRLVSRAVREGFTLIACPRGTVIEVDPSTIRF
ncbi:MAG: hypothetical protein J6I54_00735 [Bacteroidaceae bacterium]|nr:hypothetical protein [Bacteroidaceae bacterium]MBR1467881.1 hypothetical protein [Bacteroidaceae bacterium]